MRTAIRWLRICFWVGAVVDALAATAMLYPPLSAFMMPPGFQPGSDYRYAIGMGASLMLGWSALLVWADRRPMERKGVLLLTVFPAIAGLVVSEAQAVLAGFLPPAPAGAIWALQGILTVMFLASYWRARRSEASAQRAVSAQCG